MKLTSNEALKMLEEFEKGFEDNKWIRHSRCVGNTAGVIAEQLGLDVDKAKTLGYIHDIGKAIGDFSRHVINGYNYLKELGYDEEYANVCLVHSYLNNDMICTAGGVGKDEGVSAEMIVKHEYTIYEKIINLCDLMCTDKTVTLEKRLIDILVRKGVHENTIYHIQEAQKLKQEFDEKLGFNVYKLFPNILDN